MAINSRGSAAATFGDAPRFVDLWNGTEGLARWYPSNDDEKAFDYSRADSALLTQLAFWTGRDTARMERLWLSSPLAQSRPDREKLNRTDYRSKSVTGAAMVPRAVYSKPRPVLPGTEASQAASPPMLPGTEGEPDRRIRQRVQDSLRARQLISKGAFTSCPRTRFWSRAVLCWTRKGFRRFTVGSNSKCKPTVPDRPAAHGRLSHKTDANVSRKPILPGSCRVVRLVKSSIVWSTCTCRQFTTIRTSALNLFWISSQSFCPIPEISGSF